METNKNSFLTLPGAIIVAGAIVAIAIIWTQKPVNVQQNAGTAEVKNPLEATGNVAPITATDHILGNPIAPVKLIEYSDPSCPYCKIYNATMEQIMDRYGADGQVAWVYRQFPLYKADPNGNVLHPHAGTQAEAFECAASLGGNSVFWAYEKEWFRVFPEDGANRSVTDDQKQLADVAKTIGLDPVSFNDCLSSGRFKDKVDQAYTAGLNAGVSGTPYTVIITPSGTSIVRPGVESYSTLKSIIDTLLSGQQPSK